MVEQCDLQVVVPQEHVEFSLCHGRVSRRRFDAAPWRETKAPSSLRHGGIRIVPLDEPVEKQEAVKVVEDEINVRLCRWPEPSKENENIWLDDLRRNRSRGVIRAAVSRREVPHAKIRELVRVSPKELIESCDLRYKWIDRRKIAVQLKRKRYSVPQTLLTFD